MRTNRRRQFAVSALLLAPALFLWLRCESTPPHARLLGEAASPGAAATVSPAMRRGSPASHRAPAPLRIGSAGLRVVFEAGDAGSGLRRARLRLLHIDGEGLLFERHYPGSLLFGGERAKARRIEAALDPRALGLTAGGAMLILDTWDWSLASWLGGNHSVLETPLRIEAEMAGQSEDGAQTGSAASLRPGAAQFAPAAAGYGNGGAQAESTAAEPKGAAQSAPEAARPEAAAQVEPAASRSEDITRPPGGAP